MAFPRHEFNPQNLQGPLPSQLLVHGFYFSQGSTPCLRIIFDYLHVTCPGLTQIDPEALAQQARPVVNAVFSNYSLHKPTLGGGLGGVEDELKTLPVDWNTRVNAPPKDKQQVIKDLTERIILRDYKYRKGRPRAEKGHGARGDPHLSHICYYALQSNPAGQPVYNEMFREIGHYLKEHSASLLPDTQDKLREVIEAYNQHHPQQPPVTLPDPALQRAFTQYEQAKDAPSPPGHNRTPNASRGPGSNIPTL